MTDFDQDRQTISGQQINVARDVRHIGDITYGDKVAGSKYVYHYFIYNQDKQELLELAEVFLPAMAIIDVGKVKVGGIFAVESPLFSISIDPISNRQYAEFLRQNREHSEPHTIVWLGREPERALLDEPVVGVSWYDATAYCRWVSECTDRRYVLPNEVEWEKAFFEVRSGIESSTISEWISTLWGRSFDQAEYPYPQYNAADGRERINVGKDYRRIRKYLEVDGDVVKIKRLHSLPTQAPKNCGFRVVNRS